MRRPTIWRSVVLLGLFLVLGFILRMLFFESATFGYDQARDAFQSISILAKYDLKIMGPTTDIKGLFHGPIFWYLISPFYYFSGGNPLAARFFMILINLVNVVFIYYFAKKMFRDERVALVSSFLFAVSFEAIQYARWISNPPPALFFIALFFYGLWLVLQKKSKGLPLMVFAWSLAINFQLFLLYQAVFLFFAILYLLRTDRTIIFKDFKSSTWWYGASALMLSPFLIAQVKFKFVGLQAVLSYLTQGKDRPDPLLPKLVSFYNKLIGNISYNLTAHNTQIATVLLVGLLGFLIYWYYKKKKNQRELFLLFIWLISPVLIYPFEKNDSYFLNIGNLYPLILLTSFLIVYISKKFLKIELSILLFLTLLIASLNVYLVVSRNMNGETLFSVQYRQTLYDEKKIMDYVYKESDKKAFSINALTNPLFIHSTWAYLFDWYGKRKFGYMPVWLGYPLGDVGKDIEFAKFPDKQEGHLLYLIIEPLGFPESYIEGYIQYEDTRSKLLEEVKIGTHRVQKRLLINNNAFVRGQLEQYLVGGALHR